MAEGRAGRFGSGPTNPDGAVAIHANDRADEVFCAGKGLREHDAIARNVPPSGHVRRGVAASAGLRTRAAAFAEGAWRRSRVQRRSGCGMKWGSWIAVRGTELWRPAGRPLDHATACGALAKAAKGVGLAPLRNAGRRSRIVSLAGGCASPTSLAPSVDGLPPRGVDRTLARFECP
jgi:hypothetical protein